MRKPLSLLLLALVLPLAQAQTVVTTAGSWDLYRGTSIVSSHSSEAACVEAARVLNVTRTYTCRTRTSVAVTAASAPPPPPPPPPPTGSTASAASCALADVQAAAATVTDGGTVLLPACSAAWSGGTLSRAVTIKGQGPASTKIAVSGVNVVKPGAGVLRVSDIGFSKSAGGNESKAFVVTGSWPSSGMVVFERNEYTISNSGLFRIEVPGGVLISASKFTGDWDDSFLQLKDIGGHSSWAVADTMGSKDLDGKQNIYIERNTFYGGTNQGLDADDAARVVFRYNDLLYSSFNSHGLDTSAYGVRHYEVYNNTFRFLESTAQIANQNWSVWLRGGTGTIFGNSFADIAGSWWGNKSELQVSIRGAEDVRPQGACSNVSYPVPRQVGQNHDGTRYFTDPVYVWGNTGTLALGAGWNWGNPCGLVFDTFFQVGRDLVNGQKPGYVPYQYPHPLSTAN